MRQYGSIFDQEVELTEEREKHILTFHPEIEECFDKIEQTLNNPDEIRESVSNAKVLLFYKKFSSIGDEKYICVVVKTNQRWFILTIYLTRRLVGKKYELGK